MSRRKLLLRGLSAVCSGLLLASAFPPMEDQVSAWVAFVPLLLMAIFSPPFVSFRWGFFSGLVFWLISLSWLLHLSKTWGPLPVVGLGWVLLSCYCALYTGAFAMTVSALWPKGIETTDEHGWTRIERTKKKSINSSFIIHHSSLIGNVGLIFAIPLLWVGFEYLRSTLFTGFPWNALGVSQYSNLSVIQVAEWGGVYAVSAIVMVMNTALTLTALRLVAVYTRQKQKRLHVELMTGLLICALCWMYGARTILRMRSKPVEGVEVRIVAVQPNIPQKRKWSPGFVAQTYDRLERLTEWALRASNPDLIIWPETAVPDCIRTDPECTAFVRDMASMGVPILVGAMDMERAECGTLNAERGMRSMDPGTPISDLRVPSSEMRYYNSSFLVDTDGEILQQYRKVHLVPFGEYLPFDKRIGFLKKLAPIGYSCTPGTETTVFRLMKPENTGGRSLVNSQQKTWGQEPGTEVMFSVLICFEDIMASLARESVRSGARLLVNQTNDAWFDETCGPLQHMSHCVFRCVENRVPAVRAANTGVTCFIDSTGHLEFIGERDPACFTSATKTSSVLVRGRDMPLTFYTRYGDIPFALPCGIMAATFFILAVIRERRHG